MSNYVCSKPEREGNYITYIITGPKGTYMKCKSARPMKEVEEQIKKVLKRLNNGTEFSERQLTSIKKFKG